MANNLYRIETICTLENPKINGSAMLYCDGGIVFAKLHPVRINAKPKADDNEVAHGKWENITDLGGGNCFGVCSVCKTTQKVQNATALKVGHRYCSWCGTKMDIE